MKIGKLLLIGLVVGIVWPATASSEAYLAPRGINNYLSLRGGAQALLNDGNLRAWREEGFGFLTPGGELIFGHYFFPWSSLQASVLVGNCAMYSYYNPFSKRFDLDYPRPYAKPYGIVSAAIMFDISHMMHGYHPNRPVTFSIYLGPGLAIADVYEYDNGPVACDVALVTGAQFSFRLSSHLYLDFDLKCWSASSLFREYSFSYSDLDMMLQTGLTYVFGGKRFIRMVEAP